MEIVPSAVGQSEGVVVFWDHHPEIGVAWPRPLQLIDELKWGIGSLNQRKCLVLYLFTGEQSIELYLLEELPTSPTENVDVFALLCEWRPQVLKIRFGDSPIDREREVTFLLPQGDGQGMMDKLQELTTWTLDAEASKPGTVDMGHLSVIRRLDECLSQSSHTFDS
ncbi:hypothetical protein [Alicyclobacillus mengziensis]|uniref:Uncharacterized protein n=1 Tax=Alicyclobacillus mengziensis TaxID=2931921 RepID=A0A9X7VXL2_9BACL|nr:hypothetical protein [Alicyclobacillus mengziensis]QSO46347.1 hypothetical protein JZ786_17885 [Alicyclobacillus mengziensis]